MKGDIAQRSIRSSMSRIVEARLPRMISSVTASTVVAAFVPADEGTSDMGALHEEIVRAVHASAEARCDEAGRIVLVDDGRPGERHARGEPVTRVDPNGRRAAAAEIDRALTDGRDPRIRRGGNSRRRHRALRQHADGGDAKGDQLDLRSWQIVAVQPPVLGVERLNQPFETRGCERAIAERARQLEALVLVAKVGAPLEPLAIPRD